MRQYFNPRSPHGERQDVLDGRAGQRTISIHAPAWGATPTSQQLGAVTTYFNPRPRMGSDNGRTENSREIQISIHAPAWGATSPDPSWRTLQKDFNPRPRMGSDIISEKVSQDFYYFNPRPRMGSDVARTKHRQADHIKFQSTPPHGERQASR